MYSGSDILRWVQGKQPYDGECSVAWRSCWFCWAAGAVATSRLQHCLWTCSLQLRAPCTHKGVTLFVFVLVVYLSLNTDVDPTWMQWCLFLQCLLVATERMICTDGTILCTLNTLYDDCTDTLLLQLHFAVQFVCFQKRTQTHLPLRLIFQAACITCMQCMCGLLLHMSHVAWSVCLYHVPWTCSTKTGEQSKIPFRLLTHVETRSHLLDGVKIRRVHSQQWEATSRRCCLLPN